MNFYDHLDRTPAASQLYPPFEFNDLIYPFPTKKARLSSTLEVAYIDVGTGPEVLLMVHGLGSYLPAWSKVINGLRDRFRCIAIDLPGYGKSSKDDYPVTMDFFVTVIKGFLEKLAIEKVYYAGHSMGGQIGVAFALKYPETVNKLALAAPAGFELFNANELFLIQQTITPFTVKHSSPAQIRANFESNFFIFPRDAEFMVKDRLQLRGAKDFPMYCRVVAKSIRAMATHPVLHSLPDLHTPTVVIFGENDALIPNRFLRSGTPRQIAQAGTSAIPNAHLVMVPNCGHFVMFERPSETVRAIKSL